MNTSLGDTILGFIPQPLFDHTDAFPADDSLWVTLTMKQQAWIHGVKVKLDEPHAQKNFHHFMNKLNRECFGRATLRGKAVVFFAALSRHHWADGHPNPERLHYHAVLRRPRNLVDDPVRTINDCWHRTYFGDHHTHIEPVDNERGGVPGLLRYLRRQAIDWDHNLTARSDNATVTPKGLAVGK